MTPDIAAQFLFLLITAGVILWILYGPWQTLVIDIARLELFGIRDEIFDLAADANELSFESRLYKTVREDLNRLIRFLHHFTWPRMLVLHWTHKRHPSIDSSLDMINKVPNSSVRHALNKRFILAYLIVLGAIWLRSPFLIVITVPLMPVVVLVFLVKGSIQRLEKYAKIFVTEVRADAALARKART